MKILKLALIVLSLSVLLFSCRKDNNGSESEVIAKEKNGVFLQEINKAPLVQYTPNLSPWNRFENAPLQNIAPYNPVGFESHSVNDLRYMTAADWKNNHWDGTPFNPEKLTRKELHAAMFPRHQIMVGLKQLYNRHKPFADERNPTKAEVDEWNRLVINHFRALCGYGADQYKVKNSHALYIMSLWSDEVKYSTKWDNHTYRGGKTVIQDKRAIGNYLGRGHYGYGFIAPSSKQGAYCPSGVTPTFFKGGTAEGVSGVRKWHPWSIKLSVVLGKMLEHEGFWGGHLGPLWHREKIGISYYKEKPRAGSDDRWVQVRLLYHGQLNTPLYVDPDGPQTGKPSGPGGKY